MPPIRIACAGYVCVYIIWSAKAVHNLAVQNQELRQKNKVQHELLSYLADMIDRYDVPITEFDRIALEAIVNE